MTLYITCHHCKGLGCIHCHQTGMLETTSTDNFQSTIKSVGILAIIEEQQKQNGDILKLLDEQAELFEHQVKLFEKLGEILEMMQ